MKEKDIYSETKKPKEKLYDRCWRKICPILTKFAAKTPRAAIVRIICITVIVIIGSFLFECVIKVDGKNYLSDFCGEHLRNHSDKKFDWVYLIYYVVMYIAIINYVVSVMWYGFKKNDNPNWCLVAIAINAVFVVFMTAYLTILLQYGSQNTTETMYNAYITSYAGLATFFGAMLAVKFSVSYSRAKPTKEEPIKDEPDKS